MPQTLHLAGVIPPLITPLDSKGHVDSDSLNRLINHLINGGVSGLFLFGSSGEGPWLNETQLVAVLKEAHNAVNGRVPILAGLLEPSTPRVIQLMHAIEKTEAADAIVVTTPYYFGSDSRDQIEHFTRVADASALPIVLYNIPPMTHHMLAVETVDALLDHENIVGIKDSAGDMDAFRRLIQLKESRPTFSVLQGAENLAFDALVCGADGIVPGLGNIVPGAFATLIQDVHENRHDAARAAQSQLVKLGKLHDHDYWLKCLKYAASLLGFGSGRTVAHSDDLTDDTQEAIRAHLRDFGVTF